MVDKNVETVHVDEKNYSLTIHTSLHKFCLCVDERKILNLRSEWDYARSHGTAICFKENLLINPESILFMEFYEICDDVKKDEENNPHE